MLQDVSAFDFRMIVSAVLWVLGGEFLETVLTMRKFAPGDFDDDLYELFAWLYGPLLLDCCCAYLSDVNLESKWILLLTYEVEGFPAHLRRYGAPSLYLRSWTFY